MERKKPKIYFELPDDVSVIKAGYEILEENQIQEKHEEWMNKLKNKEDTYALIIVDTAEALFTKKIQEDKLTELVTKHLSTTKDIAQKIILDIKEKILPYAKIIGPEELGEEKPLGVKKVEIGNVEKNAEIIQKKKTSNIAGGTIGENVQRKGDDKYREQV